jgi:photosystem II stability/assembly factor-like uncharacterized protein
MDDLLLLATARGLVLCDGEEGAWRECARALTDHRVRSVSASDGVILAGTARGIFRSGDLGQTWHDGSAGMTHRHVRWLAHHPGTPGLALSGTEPAAIFLSRDGGQTWRECREVERLRDAHQWYLPYSPEAGCVRGFAFHGPRAYAAVEVGGVLRSDDSGGTWRLAGGSTGDPDPTHSPDLYIHPDLHSIAVHPSSPDLVLAATGGGLYRSADGGKTWKHLYRCYCRAAWIDPNDPDHLIFGPADSVSRGGRVERTCDGGRTWELAGSELDAPWPRHMVERFVQMDDQLLAVLSNGDLLAASLATLAWRRILPGVEGVEAATTMPR